MCVAPYSYYALAWDACSATLQCTRVWTWQYGSSVWRHCWSNSKHSRILRHISLIRGMCHTYSTSRCVEADMRFAGQVALVTGSSRGIGRAIALRLARDGADVVVHYRRQTVAAQETAAAITALGRRVLVVQADLGETPAVRRLFAPVHETFGVLDIFVANAAATAFKPLLEQQQHHLD